MRGDLNSKNKIKAINRVKKKDKKLVQNSENGHQQERPHSVEIVKPNKETCRIGCDC